MRAAYAAYAAWCARQCAAAQCFPWALIGGGVIFAGTVIAAGVVRALVAGIVIEASLAAGALAWGVIALRRGARRVPRPAPLPGFRVTPGAPPVDRDLVIAAGLDPSGPPAPSPAPLPDPPPYRWPAPARPALPGPDRPALLRGVPLGPDDAPGTLDMTEFEVIP